MSHAPKKDKPIHRNEDLRHTPEVPPELMPGKLDANTSGTMTTTEAQRSKLHEGDPPKNFTGEPLGAREQG